MGKTIHFGQGQLTPVLMIFWLFVSVSSPAQALDDGILEPSSETGVEDGLGNSLIRSTVTPQGETFYREFASLLRLEGPETYGMLSVEERPWRQAASIIQLEYNRQVIFRAILRPQGTTPGDLALAALENLNRVVSASNTSQGRSSRYEPDLAEEELR
ncbi:MAG: CsgE family curli-type amyloid fiber assembly protein [Oleiphilaceae bacterium]|nr:CsgE family curli-type amyloid fiber assembly protein [Oleiphilaceae bacterium]